MMSSKARPRIAILDDYQDTALKSADWTQVLRVADVDVFSDHLDDRESVIHRLFPYHIVCVMRERTPLSREMIDRLPNLRMIASTGRRNASIDVAAAAAHGIFVAHTGYIAQPTVELTWALILGGARNLITESASLRSGGWQQSIGDDIAGSTLGIIGLGNLGSRVATIGIAFGMNVIAWSQNLTSERTSAFGVELVTKEVLLRTADVVSIHLILSPRTTGLIGAADFALMKPTARLVNTSRGPIVDEIALLNALATKQIAGAAIDVFDHEPLPPDHPFRSTDCLLATPHIGYASRNQYARFYGDAVANIMGWISENAALAPARERESPG